MREVKEIEEPAEVGGINSHSALPSNIFGGYDSCYVIQPNIGQKSISTVRLGTKK